MSVLLLLLSSSTRADKSKAAGAFMTQELPIAEHTLSAEGQVPDWLRGTLVSVFGCCHGCLVLPFDTHSVLTWNKAHGALMSI